MGFREDYTTAEKISRDQTGKEVLKTTLSNDAWAVCDALESLRRIFAR